MPDKKNEKQSCKCPYCDAELEVKEMPFCENCNVNVDFTFCQKCGKPIPPEVTVCPDCGQS